MTWPAAPADAFMSLGAGGNCASDDSQPWARGRRRRCQLGREPARRPRLRPPTGSSRCLLEADGVKTAATAAMPVQVNGERKVWHPVSLTFQGPESSETADPNPFRDYRLTVVVHPRRDRPSSCRASSPRTAPPARPGPSRATAGRPGSCPTPKATGPSTPSWSAARTSRSATMFLANASVSPTARSHVEAVG